MASIGIWVQASSREEGAEVGCEGWASEVGAIPKYEEGEGCVVGAEREVF